MTTHTQFHVLPRNCPITQIKTISVSSACMPFWVMHEVVLCVAIHANMRDSKAIESTPSYRKYTIHANTRDSKAIESTPQHGNNTYQGIQGGFLFTIEYLNNTDQMCTCCLLHILWYSSTNTKLFPVSKAKTQYWSTTTQKLSQSATKYTQTCTMLIQARVQECCVTCSIVDTSLVLSQTKFTSIPEFPPLVPATNATS